MNKLTIILYFYLNKVYNLGLLLKTVTTSDTPQGINTNTNEFKTIEKLMV